MYNTRLLKWTDVHYSRFSCLLGPLTLAPAPAAVRPIRGLSCDAMFPDVEQKGGGEKRSLLVWPGEQQLLPSDMSAVQSGGAIECTPDSVVFLLLC